eukprot:scaffold38411_cov213-Isochrysis_galbana.AAC.1
MICAASRHRQLAECDRGTPAAAGAPPPALLLCFRLGQPGPEFAHQDGHPPSRRTTLRSFSPPCTRGMCFRAR